MSLELQGQGVFADTGTYSKIGAVSTLKIISGNQTIDAVRMTVVEHTYGVVFSFTVSKLVYNELGWQSLAAEYAAKVQTVGQYEGTQAMQYVQDTTKGFQLADMLIVTVGTDDGFVSIDVEIPLSTADTPASVAKYQNAYTAGIAGLVALN